MYIAIKLFSLSEERIAKYTKKFKLQIDNDNNSDNNKFNSVQNFPKIII